MGVVTEAGYTWTNGKHARLLHAGNIFNVEEMYADNDSGTTDDLPDNDLTVDKWVPFTNGSAAPDDFSATDWTKVNCTVGSDGQTITLDNTTGNFSVQESVTVSGAEQIFALRLQRVNEGVKEVRLQFVDSGATTYYADIRLDTGAASGTLNVTSSQIVDLGDNTFELWFTCTPASGAGTVQIFLTPVLGSVFGQTATGTEQVKFLRFATHENQAWLRANLWTAQSGTCMAVAAHNFGDSAGRIDFQHDSNDDGTFTDILVYDDIPDNSPIMCFFDAISSSRWRLAIRNCVLPEIGIFRVGDPLTFERPFYAGFTPSRMARQTDIIGNISRSGELLGRSKKRTILALDPQWQNLTYSWLRANIDAPGGVIQSLEDRTAFMAWRPEEATDDVSYIMRAQSNPPTPMGVRDLWSFGLSCEVYSYE